MLRKHHKVIAKKPRLDICIPVDQGLDPAIVLGQQIEVDQNGYDYKCRYCDRAFKKSVSLGGHISKAHNGKSELYKKKMEIRESRQQDREYLA